jgi:hypothetical protein
MGKVVRLPQSQRDHPAEEFLRWQNENVYLG